MQEGLTAGGSTPPYPLRAKTITVVWEAGVARHATEEARATNAA